MTDAEAIARLAEIGEELAQLRALVDRIQDLEGEAKQLSEDLFQSMKIQDVYDSGNFGHEPRKLRWLVELFRDWKNTVEGSNG